MSDLSEEIIKIGKEYIGLGAESYLKRQCKNHLDKNLDKVEKSDLDDLADWVEKKASLVMDEDDVSEMAKEIEDLRYKTI